MIVGIVVGSTGTFTAAPMLKGAAVATPLPFVPKWSTTDPNIASIVPSEDGLTAVITPTAGAVVGDTLTAVVENPDGTAVSSFSIPVLAVPQDTIVDSYVVSQTA